MIQLFSILLTNFEPGEAESFAQGHSAARLEAWQRLCDHQAAGHGLQPESPGYSELSKHESIPGATDFISKATPLHL